MQMNKIMKVADFGVSDHVESYWVECLPQRPAQSPHSVTRPFITGAFRGPCPDVEASCLSAGTLSCHCNRNRAKDMGTIFSWASSAASALLSDGAQDRLFV